MSGGHAVVDESMTAEKNGGGGVMRTMHVAVVCSAVGFLSFVVVILGVSGEATTAKALDDTASNLAQKCVYRTTPALGCGIAAAMLALMAEGVVTAATVISCACFRPTPEVPATQAKRIVSIVLFANSWIIVVIVVALFIAGAAFNADHEREPNADGYCDLNPGSPMFAAATVMSVLATAMQIGSYILLQATPPTGSTKPPELAMGQPVQPEHQQERDAEEEVVADSVPPPPPYAPPLPRDTEPTSQVS